MRKIEYAIFCMKDGKEIGPLYEPGVGITDEEITEKWTNVAVLTILIVKITKGWNGKETYEIIYKHELALV